MELLYLYFCIQSLAGYLVQQMPYGLQEHILQNSAVAPHRPERPVPRRCSIFVPAHKLLAADCAIGLKQSIPQYN